MSFDYLQDPKIIGWTHMLQILTSQIIDKQFDELKFGIYIYGNESNFMKKIYDHGILI